MGIRCSNLLARSDRTTITMVPRLLGLLVGCETGGRGEDPQHCSDNLSINDTDNIYVIIGHGIPGTLTPFTKRVILSLGAI